MDRKELKAYVKRVYELHTSVYQQEQLVKNIEGEISRLPKKPQTDDGWIETLRKLGLASLAVALILYCINAITWYNSDFVRYLNVKNTSPDLLIQPPHTNERWLFLEFIGTWMSAFGFFFLCIGAVTVMYTCLVSYLSRKSYQKQLAAYTESQTYRHTLNTELSAVKEKRAETEKLLAEFYNVPDEDDDCFIHKDYRDFIPVSYFYQLLDHKQASTLPDCYDRFDTAVYRHNVLTKMDDIRRDLNQIRISQVMLYQAVTRSNEINEGIYNELVSLNDTGAQISGKLNDIDRSTRLLERNSELSRREEEYRRFLDDFKDH